MGLGLAYIRLLRTKDATRFEITLASVLIFIFVLLRAEDNRRFCAKYLLRFRKEALELPRRGSLEGSRPLHL